MNALEARALRDQNEQLNSQLSVLRENVSKADEMIRDAHRRRLISSSLGNRLLVTLYDGELEGRPLNPNAESHKRTRGANGRYARGPTDR